MDDAVYRGAHVLQWHITHRCNLRCSHCYQTDYGRETTREELFGALDAYERFVRGRALAAQINLTGGEPLAHPDFFALAREIRRRGMALGVLSNGTLIGDAVAGRLADLDPRFVQISLDGTRRVHDAIRGEGSFDRAMYGVDALKRRGVRVNVSFTAQSLNYRSLVPLALQCRAHGVDKLWFDRVVIAKEEDASALSLTTEQFRALVKTAGRLSRLGLVDCGRSLQFLGAKGTEVYRCGAGGELLILLADGGLMPCRRLPYVIGNIRDGEIEDIVSHSEIMRSLAAAPLPEGCRDCEYAARCRGGAKCVTCARTGDPFGKDVNCWL